MVLKWTVALLIITVVAGREAGRIIGGEDAIIEDYPSIVQIESFDALGWHQTCAASILLPNWVLSAARCFYGADYSPERRRVRAGTSFRNFGGVLHYVEFAKNHPDYRRETLNDADINVVKLASPLMITPVIQMATIVVPETVLPDLLPVIHVGWGNIEWEGEPSSSRFLRAVEVITINRKTCKKNYNDVGRGIVTENMICSGVPIIGGRGACDGDTGGPMYVRSRDSLVVVGVISWGYRCGNATYPRVSTAVSPFTNWIIENAK